MCDEDTVDDNEKFLNSSLSRRQFNTLTIGAAAALMLPKVANALDVVSNTIEVKTDDGIADCYFVHPSTCLLYTSPSPRDS